MEISSLCHSKMIFEGKKTDKNLLTEQLAEKWIAMPKLIKANRN